MNIPRSYCDVPANIWDKVGHFFSYYFSVERFKTIQKGMGVCHGEKSPKVTFIKIDNYFVVAPHLLTSKDIKTIKLFMI